MKFLGVEIVTDAKLPPTTALLVPSRLPHGMTLKEAAEWMRKHTVAIVDWRHPSRVADLEQRDPIVTATSACRIFGKLVAERLRPLVAKVDSEFRMVLTVSFRGRNVQVQIGPEPYRDTGFQDSSR